MSDNKRNEAKSHGWNEWANKKNDWNISNIKDSKRPKLDIHKNHLSQSSSVIKPNPAPAGRGGSFRRTNSLPTKSNSSPMKEDGFMDIVQEEFDANEAKALAQAAAAIELEMAQSNQLCSKSTAKESNIPSTSSKPPVKAADYRNNGSSGFDILFSEELADEDVEECMLLASQEIMASQNAAPVVDSSFSQAYSIFSKGVDAHSSILDTSSTFKKPFPSKSAQNVLPQSNRGTSSGRPPPISNNRAGGQKMQPPPRVPLPRVPPPPAQPRSSNSYCQGKTSVTNPQAEAEVRRLALEQEKNHLEIKKLKESLRTKDGEVAILRSQFRQALIEKEQQKTVSARSAEASEVHYREKFKEMEKEKESLKLKLQFQEAETNTAKERYKLLSNNSQRLRVVEPISPGPSAPSGQNSNPQRTPSRQRHVSGFLNRSTFEEPLSPRRHPAKRQRISEEAELSHVEHNLSHIPEPQVSVTKPEMRTVGEQTTFEVQEAVEIIGAQRLAPLSLGQKLADRLLGLQLVSVKFSNTELWKHNDSDLDETETIPTLSLLKLGSNSRKRHEALDECNKPCLLNCAQSLQHLLSWNDTTSDCPPTRASIMQVAEECAGILHYNLLLLQNVGRISDKQLRDRDLDIISRGLDIAPLDKNLNLLYDKQWYKEEYGVDMRRCLGILSEIALVSKFAASLVTGVLETNENIIKKHKFTKLPEYSHLQDQTDEDEHRFYFLKVLCDICSTIVHQKFTIPFNGVLAGIMTLLRNCAHHNVVEGRSESYFLNIIQWTLIARPASTVLLRLVDLLTAVSGCEAIMKGLCTKCDDDDCIIDNSGFYSFTKDTCALQVLCIQMRAVSEPSRWRLVDAVTKWLVAVVSQVRAAPSWIISISEDSNSSHTHCCTTLMSMLVSLLWDGFEMLQEIIEKETLGDVESKPQMELRSTLVQVMRRAIILLTKILENNMFKYAARIEGLYDLLVQGIPQIKKHLELSSSLERLLEDLIRSEQDMNNTGDFETSNSKFNLYLESAVNSLNLS